MLAAFASVDKNNDGTVTREELFQKITERRAASHSDKKHADADKGEKEARAGRPRPGDGRGPNPESIFERFDKDKTGSLTKDNVPERLWNRISKADSNNDGKVSKEELQTFWKNRSDGKPAEPKKEAAPETKPAEQKPADKPSAQVAPLDVEQAVSALVTEN